MSASELILQVAVPTPLRRVFDYLPPLSCEAADLAPGARVRVPFGRGETLGLLLGTTDSSPYRAKLKPALELLDREALFPTSLLQLLHFASDYYHHPIGEVAELMLPVALRAGAKAERKALYRWRATRAGHALDLLSLKRAPRQIAALALLRRHADGVDEALLRAEEVETTTLKALAEKGLAERSLCLPGSFSSVANPEGPALNAEQAAALAVVRGQSGYASYLLNGVTGSGKTEVYLQLAADCVAAGKQALILVPEIGLTPQTVQRFEARFSVPLAVLHSGLSDGERLDAWLRARDGEARIVLGTRSALFTPLKNPGLIVVDEEHDASYKQQDGLRYSARDLALVRGRLEQLPVVLGSATPSLETLHLTQTHRMTALKLSRRAGEAKPPTLHVLDVRKLPLDEGLSPPLKAKMNEHLQAGGQVLIFLNRRGFAPALMCHDCGWLADCQHCDARYTLHQEPRRLHCHHCDAIKPIPRHCPSCQSSELLPVGLGTERLEARLSELFPEVAVVRIDRDSTRRKDALRQHLDGIHSGRYRLLVGTQMLAKGHHFPGVTLVVLPDVDGALFSSDFRAPERLAQLLIQVAGRAGRADKPGEVVLQTRQPEHPVLTTLLREGYAGFAAMTLNERQQALLPPFRHLALLRAEAKDKHTALAMLGEVRQLARAGGTPVGVLGPAPAPMERRGGRYRAQLLFEAQSRKALHQLLDGLLPSLESLPAARKVRWSLDVDPQEML